MSDPANAKTILLHPSDNVEIARAPIAEGEVILIDGRPVRAASKVEVGHKIARRPIAPADKILRYGASIGSATAPIAPGEHVHMHNMKSDYIAAHDRTAAEAREEGRA
jgi:hypothetical protein